MMVPVIVASVFFFLLWLMAEVVVVVVVVLLVVVVVIEVLVMVVVVVEVRNPRTREGLARKSAKGGHVSLWPCLTDFAFPPPS